MGNITTSIAAIVDDRLSVFKPEIVAELVESSDSAAKKLKLMDQPQIKSEGKRSGPSSTLTPYKYSKQQR